MPNSTQKYKMFGLPPPYLTFLNFTLKYIYTQLPCHMCFSQLFSAKQLVEIRGFKAVSGNFNIPDSGAPSRIKAGTRRSAEVVGECAV